ncbi:hypothetical protein [Spirillospora sp. NBC_01491]|uniref:hypothetical protein n=1 Tax=Spirillospora sp. NBC_01491 TaxID=2976007 RepID=UPI002E3458E5|nr:hypothetical protein [Spirillospora sp. NBC_01491]
MHQQREVTAKLGELSERVAADGGLERPPLEYVLIDSRGAPLNAPKARAAAGTSPAGCGPCPRCGAPAPR